MAIQAMFGGTAATDAHTLLPDMPPPVHLTWDNISFSVKSKKAAGGRKAILSDLSGSVRNGRFLAIIGASGGGKTSLLNALAGRLSPTSGSVRVNGKPLRREDRHAVVYVAQEDALMPTASVHDTLNMSAQLRLPRSMKKETKDALVRDILQLFRLTKCKDTIVGSADESIRGISGGERKRLSIAVELISNPSLIFLDEPTSGLDSQIAADVCSILKSIAGSGRTVVASIHQPSSDVFEQFDQLLILSHGHPVYFGAAEDAVAHFTTLDPVRLQCPPRFNPSDFFMSMTYRASDQQDTDATLESAVSKSGPADGSGWNTTQLVEGFRRELGKQVYDELEAVKTLQMNGVHKRDMSEKSSTLLALKLLSIRAFNNMLRSKILMFARLAQTIVLSLIVIAVYGELGYDQGDIQSINGIMFFVGINMIMMSILNIVISFPVERSAFVRDHHSGMYSSLAYFCTKVLVELPFQILFPTIMAIIVYYPTGMRMEFGYFVLVITLMNNVGQAWGMMLGCVCKNAEMAITLAPVTILPFIIFGGLLANFDTMPEWLRWIKYVSPVRYSYEALLQWEFAAIDDKLGGLTCEKLHEKMPMAPCPYTSGLDWMETAGMGEFTGEECMYVLGGMYILFRVLSYVFLVLTTRRR